MGFIKKHKALTAVIAVVLVLAVAFGSVAAFYLGKIDFDRDRTAQEAPTDPLAGTDGDELNSGKLSAQDASALSGADQSIRENLDDSKVWYSDDVFNILLMGIDYGSKTFPYGRSDAMIVVSINKKLHSVKLISVSRTAYSSIPGYKNTRLNHAHGYGGPALAIAAIEKNYKFRIDRYASVSFDSFKQIIDAFGGVQLQMTEQEARAMFGKGAGTYTLDGKNALIFARLREIDNDKTRTGRQRRILLAIAQKAKAMSAGEAIGMLSKVLPLVRTDFSRTQLVSQAASALGYLKWENEQYVLPHKSSNLVLRDGFEVVLVDWKTEVPYVHDLVYKGVEVKYENAK